MDGDMRQEQRRPSGRRNKIQGGSPSGLIKNDGFRSNLGRHGRWHPCSFFLCFLSLLDVNAKVKVRRNKLRFLVVGAIVLLGSIRFVFY